MIVRNQPLSEQVRNQILQWIQSGRPELADGVLPSEAELAELFDTSRATIREALAQLERDRVIIRRQGSGTYINLALRNLTATANELIDPMMLIELQEHRASLGLIESHLAPVGTEACEALARPAEEQAVHTEALYLADGEPAIWLEAIIPIDSLQPAEWPQPRFTSLVRFAAEVSGRTATHSIATIKAVSVDESISKRMGIQTGLPLLTLEEVYLTDYGRPAFLSHMFLRSNIIPLRLLRNSYRFSDRVSIW